MWETVSDGIARRQGSGWPSARVQGFLSKWAGVHWDTEQRVHCVAADVLCCLMSQAAEERLAKRQDDIRAARAELAGVKRDAASEAAAAQQAS